MVGAGTHTPLDLKVRRQGELPVGTQLAWRLRAQILSGALRPGSQLPSVRELASAADVNVNTARAVYRGLEAEGYVVLHERLGTFVADEAPTGVDLRRLAEDLGEQARRAGVSAEDLAAGLYMTASDGDEAGLAMPDSYSAFSSTSPGSLRELVHGEGDQLGARTTLRRQIAKLEAELVSYPRLPVQAPAPAPRRRQAGGRLTDLAELELIRDDLLQRLDRVHKAERAKLDHRHEALAKLERMEADPARHKWQWISNEDLGEPGCKHWHVRPRYGVFGAIMGWWRVKVSSGCPLAGA